MPRTVKDPEERRRELLECAMRLFAEEGYDKCPWRAVARAAGVAPGLAYHYFDSKERMFAAAIGHYAARCAEGACAILDDRALPLDEKVERCIGEMSDHAAFPHADYFHAEGNGALHDRLSLAVCEEVRPHLAAALGSTRSRGARPLTAPGSSPRSWPTDASGSPPVRACRTGRPSPPRGGIWARSSAEFRSGRAEGAAEER